MFCEHHGAEAITETDLVITRIGPNRTAVMAALRAPMMLSPVGVGALVRGGTPIVVGSHLSYWPGRDAVVVDMGAIESHLKQCGAAVERWQRSYCRVDGDGAAA